LVLAASTLAVSACGVGSEPAADEATSTVRTDTEPTSPETTIETTVSPSVTEPPVNSDSPATTVAGESSSVEASTTSTSEPALLAEAIDIAAAIEASKTEGPLVVYGNPSQEQWDPLLAAFNERYPWIEVETFDLGGAEAFQRYLSEEATGSPTADLIVNTDGAGWLDLVARGKVLDYVDPELANLSADQAVLAPGVYAMSYDPLIAVFNTLALPLDQQPTSLAEMAEMADELEGQIGTVNVTNANAGLGTFGYLDANGEDGWAVLEQLGPSSGVEDGTGALLGKLQSGEYVASFFASGSLRALIDGTETGDLLNYRYLADATALPARGVGVTTAADSPNSAQVLINYLLSEAGQTAACGGGFTPYREGVDCSTGLPAIEQAVGQGNAILVGYPADLAEQQAAIQERWNAAFGR
jgi:iron(III) transport system substrate-binding protein